LTVLHTWGQQLHHHPHLHCVIPAGGLAPNGDKWVPCRPHFFLPVKVLSRRFRHLFLTSLRQAFPHGDLLLTGACQPLAVPQAWHRFLATLHTTEWVVYAKEPLPTSQHVLKYLARYTHRVAISNQRLVAMEEGQVSFRWKDYKHGNHLRTLTLDALEFLRRFLLHILPAGVPADTAIWLLGQSGPTGETGAVPDAAGTHDRAPPRRCGRGHCSRDRTRRAGRGMSRLPAGPHATRRDAVSASSCTGLVHAPPRV
jgi:hypothetical protein